MSWKWIQLHRPEIGQRVLVRGRDVKMADPRKPTPQMWYFLGSTSGLQYPDVVWIEYALQGQPLRFDQELADIEWHEIPE